MAATDIVLLNSAVTPGTGSVPVQYTAGQNLAAGNSVYLNSSDGRVYLADADDTSDTATVIGVALNAAAVGQPVTVQSDGQLRPSGTVPFTMAGNSHTSTTIDGLADTTFLKVNMTVTGSGVAAASTIASIVDAHSITLNNATTTSVTGVVLTFGLVGTTHSNTSVTAIPDTSLLSVGMSVQGSGIAAGTTIAAIVSSSAITLSAAAGTSLVGTPLTFGLEPGAVYIQSDMPGGICQDSSATSGWWKTIIGTAIDTATIQMGIQNSGVQVP